MICFLDKKKGDVGDYTRESSNHEVRKYEYIKSGFITAVSDPELKAQFLITVILSLLILFKGCRHFCPFLSEIAFSKHEISLYGV